MKECGCRLTVDCLGVQVVAPSWRRRSYGMESHSAGVCRTARANACGLLHLTRWPTASPLARGAVAGFTSPAQSSWHAQVLASGGHVSESGSSIASSRAATDEVPLPSWRRATPRRRSRLEQGLSIGRSAAELDHAICKASQRQVATLLLLCIVGVGALRLHSCDLLFRKRAASCEAARPPGRVSVTLRSVSVEQRLDRP